jgi:hypothetical protein
MKIEKINTSKLISKINFINDYLNILSNQFEKNNVILNNIYNINNHSELNNLLYSQIDIMYKINIGRSLKNDILIYDKIYNKKN